MSALRRIRDRSTALVATIALACFVVASVASTFAHAEAHQSTWTDAHPCLHEGDVPQPFNTADVGEGVADVPDGSAPAPIASTLVAPGPTGLRDARLDRRPPCLDGPRRPPRPVAVVA